MRILVTGAGRAIGAATVLELSGRGHEVVATARDVGLLETLPAVARLSLDVTSDESVRAALEKAGDLDAIVNNAAVTSRGPLEAFPIRRLREMFETNVVGAVRMIQSVLPAWRERGSGVIVNVTSIQGRVGTPLEGAYCATKHALEGLSESLHIEVGHFGIRVVIVEPGYIAPGMKHGESYEDHDAYAGLVRQWDGNDATLNPAGRPPAVVVARAIADAIEQPDTPLRVEVGDDAALVLGTRRVMDDATFETTMREALGLTW